MEVRDYCASLQSEVAGWKTKVHDMVGKLDHIPLEDREKVGPFFDELHTIIQEHTSRIEELSSECPADWAPEKTKKGILGGLKRMWRDLNEYHFWYRPHL